MLFSFRLLFLFCLNYRLFCSPISIDRLLFSFRLLFLFCLNCRLFCSPISIDRLLFSFRLLFLFSVLTVGCFVRLCLFVVGCLFWSSVSHLHMVFFVLFLICMWSVSFVCFLFAGVCYIYLSLACRLCVVFVLLKGCLFLVCLSLLFLFLFFCCFFFLVIVMSGRFLKY